MQFLREPTVLSFYLKQLIQLRVLEACHTSKILSFYLDLPLDAIGAQFVITLSFQRLSPFYSLCRFYRDFQLWLFNAYLHFILCAGFIETFNFGFSTLISILFCVQVLSRLSTLSFQRLSPFYSLCRFYRDFQLGHLVPALLQQEHVIGKPQIDNSSAAYANLSIMFFQSIRYNPF